jgi:two-component system sensor histidine kinase/response regulator
LLRDIRSDPELKSRQVVLMTGRPDLVTPRKGMEEGADDFLVKPVSLEALRNCVEARFKRATISWRVEDDMLVQLRASLPPQLPHEVFTPLAGIIGLTELLLEENSVFRPEELADIHRDVYQSALRLQRTLRNYLLILELQNAKSEPLPLLSPAEVEAGIGTGLTEALRLNKRAEDMTVTVEAGSIAIKQDDLSRIVEELVDNACKFSRLGTPVTVDFRSDGRLAVCDEGRGLTAEEIAAIGAFHQFERKKNEQQGLGLGLVLAQKLAALGGATFAITSEPGKGTQVQVTFPLPAPA